MGLQSLLLRKRYIQVLSIPQNATGVRSIYEDVEMEKRNTHSPDFLGILAGMWPRLGGATVLVRGCDWFHQHWDKSLSS
ncbi:hypothetical protein REPUB_Repub07fG0225500 [Reevesia pubescens]